MRPNRSLNTRPSTAGPASLRSASGALARTLGPMKHAHLLVALLLVGHANAEQSGFEYRELAACNSVNESAWRPARLTISTTTSTTVVKVDTLLTCGQSPAEPAVAYSAISTTLSIQSQGALALRCLCRRMLEFKLPRRLESGTTVYFAIGNTVLEHERVK